MSELVRVTRALLSVSDKTDLIPFARALVQHGVELISTGGTARALAEAGLRVTPIDTVTGFPEMLDGRVKTLHPVIHGGLLALRSNAEHVATMKAHGIRPIDLVCVNLYPFERTIAREGATDAEAIEQIDIGGPSMIRSGAKNFASVAVVTSADQYDRVVAELAASQGCTSGRLRADLAAAAFSKTSQYDAAIASYLGKRDGMAFPPVLSQRLVKQEELRYGENPHQRAALYVDPTTRETSIPTARQLHGKQLGYNNILDAAAALDLVAMLRGVATGDGTTGVGACVVKHTNPCGAAVASTGAGAIDAAIAGDPLAAYGGILACNQGIDAAAAERITREGTFFEVVIAPAYTPEAAAMISKRWANVRILETGAFRTGIAARIELRSIAGGMLAQDRDTQVGDPERWTHAAGPKPDAAMLGQASMLEVVCRALSSNAVVIGGSDGLTSGGGAVRLFGAGAGQMDRVASCRIAVEKAGAMARGGIAVSDAFFPFADGPGLLIDAGVRAIVHAGGSKRDQETLDLCEKRGVTCLITGMRHFRH
jgi:phosphoribosylaminoimidazolecarboxamide formyltransferase/IMP cyclohydrolase